MSLRSQTDVEDFLNVGQNRTARHRYHSRSEIPRGNCVSTTNYSHNVEYSDTLLEGYELYDVPLTEKLRIDLLTSIMQTKLKLLALTKDAAQHVLRIESASLREIFPELVNSECTVSPVFINLEIERRRKRKPDQTNIQPRYAPQSIQHFDKPFIFLSCGQFGEAEKALGKQIVNIVKKETGLDVFFAEQVHDLAGLHDKILDALRRCAGFITVMHPRGDITRPNGEAITRASVWIEQEIAIAAYIQKVEGKNFPVIGFIHKSVGREGIRDLIALNPTIFSSDDEVLAALPAILKSRSWNIDAANTIQVQIEASRIDSPDEHKANRLTLFITNNSNLRIDKYDFELSVPSAILTHQPVETWDWKRDDTRYILKGDERSYGVLEPESRKSIVWVDYCLACGRTNAINNTGFPDAIFDATIEAKFWVTGQRYSDSKSLLELDKQLSKPRR